MYQPLWIATCLMAGFGSCRTWVVMGLCLLLTACAGEDLPNEYFAELQNHYGLEMMYQKVVESVPDSWLAPPESFQATPLRREDLPGLRDALAAALAMYPKQVIRDHLKTIWLAKTFHFHGHLYAATYTYYPEQSDLSWHRFTKAIYLSCDLAAENGDRQAFLMDSFHHEFSSLLMQMNPFPESVWRKANPKGFNYTYQAQQNPGFEAMKDGIGSTEGSESLYAQGFLSDYAMTALEEDINVFSGVSLAEPERMLGLAKRHPAIARKLRIWLGYYASIAPDFLKMPLFQRYQQRGFKPEISLRIPAKRAATQAPTSGVQ
ncbi:MAG: hypothetical protein CVV27_10535 [Candidatus Melainabacteria bacterium HGW-Melainabacteria-1]|nr:MAG: hypothetical protein CVV27_10535 [Candidatus Melainabacteria bacterium HGW-Melainabacteria-1]